MPASLLALQQARILDAVRSVRVGTSWKTLVLDSRTHPLIENCLPLIELLHEGIMSIELIEHTRDPNIQHEACYILYPSDSNIRRVIEDLSHLGGPQLYAAGHIFFIDAVSEGVVNQLATSAAGPRLRGLVELFMDVWPVEGQAFTAQRPQAFRTLFQPPPGLTNQDTDWAHRAVQDELDRATKAIVNTCVLLNEFPLIRYYAPHHPPLGPLAPPPGTVQEQRHSVSLRNGIGRFGRSESAVPPPANEVPALHRPHFTQLLAESVSRALDKYVEENEVKRETGRNRAVLVITDRTMDVRAPLVHEFSYQAMANDLLPIQQGRYYRHTFINAAGQEEESDAQLTDQDALWVDIRHLHIATVADRLSAQLEEHLGKAAKYRDGKNVNDLRDMLANLPAMSDTKGELSLHVALAERCMDIFKTTHLRQQSQLEQACATRLNSDGTKVKDVVPDLVPLLADPTISPPDKARIIALYILWNETGVVDEDRKRLFQHAHLGPKEMEAVNNLTYLGVRVVKQSAGSAERALAKFSQFLGKSASGGWKRDQEWVDGDMDTARFKPLVQYLIKDLFSHKLDTATFPYLEGHGDNTPAPGFSLTKRVQSPPITGSPLSSPMGGQATSLRSQRPTWANSSRPNSRRQGSVSGASSGGSGLSRSGTGNDGWRQRVLIYVVGGMTYSEMRAAYQMGDAFQRDIYIGSDQIWTPAQFVDQVSGLANAQAGSRTPGVAPMMRVSAPPRSHPGAPGAGGVAGRAAAAPTPTRAAAGLGRPDRPDPRDGRTRVDPRDPTRVDPHDPRARMYRETHRSKQLPHVPERVSRHVPDVVKRRIGKEPKPLPSVASMPEHQRILMQRQAALSPGSGPGSGYGAGHHARGEREKEKPTFKNLFKRG